MKYPIRIFAFVCVLLFCSSCATTQIAKKQTPDQTKVDLFFAEKPSKHFKEVAFLEADGSIFHSPETLLRKLERKAEDEGCDAIINIQFSSKFWWPSVSGIGVKYE